MMLRSIVMSVADSASANCHARTGITVTVEQPEVGQTVWVRYLESWLKGDRSLARRD